MWPYDVQHYEVARIAQNLVAKTARDLREHIESWQDMGAAERDRREGLMRLLEKKRHEFARLHVAIKYLQNYEHLCKRLSKLFGVTLRREKKFGYTAEGLRLTGRGVADNLYPMWDVQGALHVLTSGSYRLLPKVIARTVRFADRPPQTLIDRTHQRLNDKLWIRLLGCRIPQAMSDVRVERGMAYLSVKDEFEVGVTLRMMPPRAGAAAAPPNEHESDRESDRVCWRLMKLRIFVAENELGPGASGSPHPVMEKQEVDWVQMRLNAGLAGSQVDVFPRIYARLHRLCVAMALEVLLKQSTGAVLARFERGAVNVHFERQRGVLSLRYWPRAPHIPLPGQVSDPANNTLHLAAETNRSSSCLTFAVTPRGDLDTRHYPALTELTLSGPHGDCENAGAEPPTLPGLTLSCLNLDVFVLQMLIAHASDRVRRLKACLHDRAAAPVQARIVPGRPQRLEVHLAATYWLRVSVALRTGVFQLEWCEEGEAPDDGGLEPAFNARLRAILSSAERDLNRDCGGVARVVQRLTNLAALEAAARALSRLGLHFVRDPALPVAQNRKVARLGPHVLSVLLPRWGGAFSMAVDTGTGDEADDTARFWLLHWAAETRKAGGRSRTGGVPLLWACTRLPEVANAQDGLRRREWWEVPVLAARLAQCRKEAPVRFVLQVLEQRGFECAQLDHTAVTCAVPVRNAATGANESTNVRIVIEKPELAPLSPWTATVTDPWRKNHSSHARIAHFEQQIGLPRDHRSTSLDDAPAPRRSPGTLRVCALSVVPAGPRKTRALSVRYDRLSPRLVDHLRQDIVSFFRLLGLLRSWTKQSQGQPFRVDRVGLRCVQFRLASARTANETLRQDTDPLRVELSLNADGDPRLAIQPGYFPQTTALEAALGRGAPLATVLRQISDAATLMRPLGEFMERRTRHRSALSEPGPAGRADPVGVSLVASSGTRFVLSTKDVLGVALQTELAVVLPGLMRVANSPTLKDHNTLAAWLENYISKNLAKRVLDIAKRQLRGGPSQSFKDWGPLKLEIIRETIRVGAERDVLERCRGCGDVKALVQNSFQQLLFGPALPHPGEVHAYLLALGRPVLVLKHVLALLAAEQRGRMREAKDPALRMKWCVRSDDSSPPSDLNQVKFTLRVTDPKMKVRVFVGFVYSQHNGALQVTRVNGLCRQQPTPLVALTTPLSLHQHLQRIEAMKMQALVAALRSNA